MTDIQAQAQDAIVAYLEASEPATLPELLEEIRVHVGVRRQNVLPVAIAALNALMKSGKICEYDQCPLDDPMDYAWLLSDEIQP